MQTEQLETNLAGHIFTELCHCQVNVSIQEITCESSFHGKLKLLLSGPGAGTLRAAIHGAGRIFLLNASIVLTPYTSPSSKSDVELTIPLAVGIGVPGLVVCTMLIVSIVICVAVLRRQKLYNATCKGDEKDYEMAENCQIRDGYTDSHDDNSDKENVRCTLNPAYITLEYTQERNIYLNINEPSLRIQESETTKDIHAGSARGREELRLVPPSLPPNPCTPAA
jgi:hypothetical protein